MMTLYYREYYDFMDIGKYVIYLYYVYIMTHMFNIWFIYLSYDSYDLYDFYEFSVSLCIHTRHPDDWLGTAKNVLAVRLVYRHVHIWSYRSHVTTQFWLWLDWEIDIIILIYIFSYSYYYWTLEPLSLEHSPLSSHNHTWTVHTLTLVSGVRSCLGILRNTGY